MGRRRDAAAGYARLRRRRVDGVALVDELDQTRAGRGASGEANRRSVVGADRRAGGVNRVTCARRPTLLLQRIGSGSNRLP
jgi:hypothetical protein